MFTDEKHIFSLVSNFIKLGCDSEKFNTLDISSKKIKCYFKKDENKCICIYDKEFSIKCFFDKCFLEEYLKSYPSYINLDSFEGK